MFRKKVEAPEPDMPPVREDATWIPMTYWDSDAALVNGKVVRARCRTCRKPVYPDWTIADGGTVLVRYKPCPSCGAKA
jgi:hypothetical protein